MKVIIIGNYSKDKQESMNRFAKMLYEGYADINIDVELWLPKVFFAKYNTSTHIGLGKWLAYIDKLIIFPFALKFRLLKKKYNSKSVRFHICDHSNSIYLKYLPKYRTIITCHDVLAIRGALGYADAYTPATNTGKIYQKWILKNLSKAKLLAAVSNFTLNQLNSLTEHKKENNTKRVVIHNGFNENFERLTDEQSLPILKKNGILQNQRYILHVGSAAARKNRKLLLDMTCNLDDNFEAKICFAGDALDKDLLSYAISNGLEKRIISIVKPDHLTLLALYSNCEAFLFPSLSEGFGWPIIEAQACGAPVITSNMEPFYEVGGVGALYANPYNSADFAKSFLSLNDNKIKSKLIKEGYNNCLRFDSKQMMNSYMNLHLS